MMETAPRNVVWKCFEKNTEMRKVLEKELPEGFSYVVNRFKLIKESEVPHESKFEAAFLVNICTEETANKFVHQLETRTGTNFNLKHSQRKTQSATKNWNHWKHKCARNVTVQTKSTNVKVGGKKGAGSGRAMGVDRQPGKNQDCKTSMSSTLRPCKLDHIEGTCFNLSVELTYDHSHEVESTGTFWKLKNLPGCD